MIVRLLWKMLQLIGIYRPYVISNAYLKLLYYYWSQRLGRDGVPVAVIDHNFIQDIESLQKQARGQGVNLIRIPYQPFYLMAALFFPEGLRDGSYRTDALLDARAGYHRLMRAFLTRWGVRTKLSGFLTPSDSFFWIREPIGILKEFGISCLVIDKEGTISPHSMEHHSRQLQEFYPFMSDAIIVWSERQRDFWQRTGVPAEKIVVAGQPRSDFFFDSSLWMSRKRLLPPGKRFILFFTFETDAYAPVPGEHIWRELRNDIHQSLIECAKGYPDHLFVVKTHPQQQDRAQVQQEFEKTGLKNILVLHGPQVSRHLIVHADLVLGFQTTALIEAILAGKRVAYAEWSQEVCQNRHHLIPFHEAGGIDLLRSRGELDELLRSLLARDDFSLPPGAAAARRPFVDIYIPNADGNVSRRVLTEVKRTIDSRNSRRGRGNK